MTGNEIMGAIGFFVMLITAISGVWWRIEGKVKVAADRADTAHEKLADHKLHVAETYVSKQGLREAVEPIMDAIQGVKGAVDHLGGRIDGIYHSATPRPRVSKS
jgi:hypothetical protein